MMKYQSAMLVTADMPAARAFYEELLGQRIAVDLGANVCFEAGFALQTRESWAQFLSIPADAIRFGGNDAELYFETEDYTAFLEKLRGRADVRFAHPPLTQPWGQQAVRLYDPDGHIVEVAETLETVIRRFLAEGRTAEQIAAEMDYPLPLVKAVEAGQPLSNLNGSL